MKVDAQSQRFSAKLSLKIFFANHKGARIRRKGKNQQIEMLDDNHNFDGPI